MPQRMPAARRRSAASRMSGSPRGKQFVETSDSPHVSHQAWKCRMSTPAFSQSEIQSSSEAMSIHVAKMYEPRAPSSSSAHAPPTFECETPAASVIAFQPSRTFARGTARIPPRRPSMPYFSDARSSSPRSRTGGFFLCSSGGASCGSYARTTTPASSSMNAQSCAP